MAALTVYTYDEAAAILGGNAPFSIRTIERMVDAGDLERIGGRMRRRISERSILSYQEGKRAIWRKDQQEAAARLAAGTRDRKRTEATPRSIQDNIATDTTSSGASRRKRRPIGGWQA